MFMTIPSNSCRVKHVQGLCRTRLLLAKDVLCFFTQRARAFVWQHECGCMSVRTRVYVPF